jgi:DNA polymerase-3 subunit gamma/tau
MLGLADRSQTIALLEEAMSGRTAEALMLFRRLYAYGAEPSAVLLDLLEHLHGASIARTLGPDALHLPADQTTRLAAIGAAASPGTLSRLWSLLLKAHEEVRRAPDPAAAAEMSLIRFCFAADLPGPEAALRRLQSAPAGAAPASPAPERTADPGNGRPMAARGGGPVASREVRPNLRAAAPETQAALASFQDVVSLIETKRDIGLKMDVERFVRLVDFKPGQITFATAQDAPSNLTQRLATRLREWTGRPWTMVIEGGGSSSETLYERDQREARAFRGEVERHPLILSLMEAFPGAEITGIRRALPPPVEVPDIQDREDDPESYDEEYMG